MDPNSRPPDQVRRVDALERVRRVLADMDDLIADEREVAKDHPPGASMHATQMCRTWWADRLRAALSTTAEKDLSQMVREAGLDDDRTHHQCSVTPNRRRKNLGRAARADEGE